MDGIPPFALISDLLSVRLSDSEKVKVLQAKTYLEAHGSLPRNVVSSLRKLYKRKSKAIETVHEARESARQSMAKKRMGLSEAEVLRRQKERIKALRRKVEDFGF
jgi:hypothetical protein